MVLPPVKLNVNDHGPGSSRHWFSWTLKSRLFWNQDLVEHILPIWVYELYTKGVYFKVFYWQYSIFQYILSLCPINSSDFIFSRFLGSLCQFHIPKNTPSNFMKNHGFEAPIWAWMLRRMCILVGVKPGNLWILGPHFCTVMHGIF